MTKVRLKISRWFLTAIMHFPLNLFMQFLAVAATTAGMDNLSEPELIARYPAMAATTILLLSAGLICDLYLLFRFARPALSSNPPTGSVPALKIDPKPWNMRDLLAAASTLSLVLVAGELVVTLTFYLVHRNQDDALPWLMATDMTLRVAILFAFVACFQQRGIDWRRAIGLRGISPAKSIGLGAMCFLAILPPLAIAFAAYSQFCRLVGIKEQAQPIADLLASSDSMVVVVLIAAFAITVAPVFEEFVFRGFAYPVLKQRWGTWRALLVVSAVFAAIHFHLPSLGPLFALALGLGLVYELSGSLLAPITMHVLFNAANVAMVLYVRAHP
ncbi:MAG: lysostaphin resistance A-like protein [Verrucomicrobiia bacterium]